MGEAAATLGRRFEVLRPHLNEFQRRLWLGTEAAELGPGGVMIVASATGVAADTVRRGRAEAGAAEVPPPGRSRRAGGGRKRAEAHDGDLVAALEELVDPVTRGDPMSPLRWTCKSTRALARALTEGGHPVSDFVVRRLLREAGYSLQANAKTTEGGQHPDRDAQFGYLNDQARAHLAAGDPVISVDAKKKEKVGEFKNGGREYQPKGSPVPVNVHDFMDKELGKVTPYGIYDVGANAGWVSVGTDHDTAEFAVATIARWWQGIGSAAYPAASRLLICADGGGSNGYRTRLWKTGLAGLAASTGLEITVCHLPPGTSKWNKIEHRLFSHISMNWRGRPLTSHEVIVQTIAATTTRTGLTVSAELDTSAYPKGIKIPDRQMEALTTSRALTRHQFHGEWNYTLRLPADTPAPD
jgi:Rhodopirellula transposase DDE domain